MLSLRYKNSTRILYILITKPSPLVSPFIPPAAFANNRIIDFLRRSPEDLFQLHDSLSYHQAILQQSYVGGHDFKIINYEHIHQFAPFIRSQNNLKVFFIDVDVPNYLQMAQDLLGAQNPAVYFHFFKEGDFQRMSFGSEVETPEELVNKIVLNQQEILAKLELSLIEVTPEVQLQFKNLNPYQFFVPTRNNYYLLNRITGNFGVYTDDAISETGDLATMKEEATKAHRNKNSWERQNRFIDQVRKIDNFIRICLAEALLRPATNHEPHLSPLLIVIPFHNPDVYSNHNREIKALLEVEQTSNYIFEVRTSQTDDVINASIRAVYDRLSYLDDVAFLHSTFWKSPVVRLPLKGKSLYHQLSIFGIKSFPNLNKPKARRKTNKILKKVGKTLKDKLISPELEGLISRRNGQIIAVTDLPIEWIPINGVPLSFIHDVCRLPETSHHSLMTLYVQNNEAQFSVAPDVLRRTLVIFGNDEPNFMVWQKLTRKLSTELGFIIEECLTREEVREAVRKHDPDLLIFDCHGGYDKNMHSTFLHIGKDHLTGEYVAQHKISAPIVFVSACGTSPTYGTFNTIAHAFFEAGALSVTTTYLPILISSGSVLYLRLLRNLDYASRVLIHKNWLEFVCHVIRTSAIHDAYMSSGYDKTLSSSTEPNSHVDAVTRALSFELRESLFKELDDRIKSFSKKELNYFTAIFPEYLFYTNLGRGDLIIFDIWRKQFLKNNLASADSIGD